MAPFITELQRRLLMQDVRRTSIMEKAVTKEAILSNYTSQMDFTVLPNDHASDMTSPLRRERHAEHPRPAQGR